MYILFPRHIFFIILNILKLASLTKLECFQLLLIHIKNQNSSVGVVTSVWVECPKKWGSVTVMVRTFVHITCGSHSASYPLATGGTFLGVNHLRHEADHSSPYSHKVKNGWRYTSPLACIHNVLLNWVQKQLYLLPLSISDCTKLCNLYSNRAVYAVIRRDHKLWMWQELWDSSCGY
jgi:hypothetical protein